MRASPQSNHSGYIALFYRGIPFRLSCSTIPILSTIKKLLLYIETLTKGELVIYITTIIIIDVSITILNSPRYRYITSAEYRAFEFSLNL